MCRNTLAQRGVISVGRYFPCSVRFSLVILIKNKLPIVNPTGLFYTQFQSRETSRAVLVQMGDLQSLGA